MRADVDNVIKPILDAFIDIVYFDDNQVAELVAMVDSRMLPAFGYTSAEASEAE